MDVDFEVIAAIDAAYCPADAMERFAWRRTGYHYSPGEIGCFLSHELVWSRMVAERIPHAVILEDDVRLSRRIPEILGDGGWIPADLHLLKLETMYFRADVDREPAASIAGVEVRRLRSKHLGSAAYLLSMEGARLLLESTRRPFGPVDHHLFDPHIRGNGTLVRYQAVPALAVQHANDPSAPWTLSIFASGIEGVSAGRHSRRLPLAAKIWREIKRPFRQVRLLQRRAYARKVHDAEAIIVDFAEDGILDGYIAKLRKTAGSMSVQTLERSLSERPQD